jgi:hypothetical protein
MNLSTMKSLAIALMLVSFPAVAQDTFKVTWFLTSGSKRVAVVDRDDSFKAGNFHCEANAAEVNSNGVISNSIRFLTCVSQTEVKVTGAECRSYSKDAIVKLPPIQINGVSLSLDCRVE